MSEWARIGFIGLGVIGGRMAGTLARAGHSLAVHDIDRAKVETLGGATACVSPKDTAQRSDIVFTSLPLPATVRVVYLAPDGVLDGAQPGTILVDTSTVDPETSRANNVMSMGNVLVAAEAFVLGVRAGMEPERLLEILRTSAGRSYHFEKRFPNILARNFAPGFTVDLARKDLGLAVDMAKSHDVPVPATSLLHQLYNACAALGEGKSDFAAIVKLFESWTGVEVKGTTPPG